AVLKQITPHPPAGTAVSATGQFRNGVVLGAHTKPAPEYIGATARQRRRVARIAECDRLIAELAAQLAELEIRLSTMDAFLARYDLARTSMPDGQHVLTAVREVDRAATELRLLRVAEAAAVVALDQAVADQSVAALALRRVTAERSLPADRVDATAEAVRRFEAEGARVEPARHAVATASAAVRAAQDRHTQAATRLDEAHEAMREAVARHEEMRESYETLSVAVGEADATRVVAEVASTETAIVAAEARLRDLRARLTTAYGAVQRAESSVESTRLALGTAMREAGQEALRLRPFAHADLLRLLRCPPDLRWPAQATANTVDNAHAAGGDRLTPEVAALHEALLAATKDLTPSENSLKQSATRLNGALTELQVQLPAAGLDHRPEIGTDDGLVVVRVADDQGLTPVATFAERIARERADQEQLLTEAERRVFEDALLTQLARQIHLRTIESRDLVDEMDAQMRSRRMSSGLTVGVGWQLADDLEPDQREICKMLDKDPARLGPAQLATLRGHFATRIKAARAMAPEQPYRELLAQVLDYRMWRVFAFSLHRPGAPAEALTRSRHSQLSGGEQSVSLHLPLFAAANALFSSASPTAPRLLGMDEAFAGVDENGRGELMSLAVQFDLDLFMTGFDLWATHPAVPGCAHYDLSHSAVEHTVATVLIVWNGPGIGSAGEGEQTADFDGTLARALGSPATRRSPHRMIMVPAGAEMPYRPSFPTQPPALFSDEDGAEL
ncbi:MAG TPA: SbcC/MukB-like Walker B domain-containing protein, partial [Jiangellales bacterium]|nr:SbcC/MukB-like Walker B domain-containing protein [Jiangellales bacterium]